MARPPGSRPSKISALAAATPASPSGKFSVCTAPTVVMATACGATNSDKGVISSAWFIPISKTARSVSAGMRDRVNGTPIWLLKLLIAEWARPARFSPCMTIWVTLVLPTEPVTAPRLAARARLRAKTARSSKPRSTSGTRRHGPPATGRRVKATTAPASNAAGTKSWPSRAPCKARKISPGWRPRLSKLIPFASVGPPWPAPTNVPPVASASSVKVQSGVVMLGVSGKRRKRH